MPVFVGTNSNQNYYVTACNRQRGYSLLRRRLLEKFGTYKITDFKQVKTAGSKGVSHSSPKMNKGQVMPMGMV